MTDLSLNVLEDCGILPLDTDEATLRAEARMHGYAFLCVDLSVIANRQDLLEAFAEDLNFPEYFGQNWDALEECLADLEWLPAKGYVLLLTAAEMILPEDEEDYATFLEVLSDAGEAWGSGMEAKRPKPFHVVLAVAEGDKSKRAHWGIEQIAVQSSKESDTRGGSSGRRKAKKGA